MEERNSDLYDFYNMLIKPSLMYVCETEICTLLFIV